MFEIALNKCTVLLSTRGLQEHILTIEALIRAHRAMPQPQPSASCLLALPTVDQHPLLESLGTASTCRAHRARDWASGTFLHCRGASMYPHSTPGRTRSIVNTWFDLKWLFRVGCALIIWWWAYGVDGGTVFMLRIRSETRSQHHQLRRNMQSGRP